MDTKIIGEGSNAYQINRSNRYSSRQVRMKGKYDKPNFLQQKLQEVVKISLPNPILKMEDTVAIFGRHYVKINCFQTQKKLVSKK